MADKIVIAGVVLLIGMVLLRPLNDIFQDNLLPMIANVTDISAFETATWGFVPLVLLIFVGAAVLVTLMRKRQGGGEGGRKE